MGPSEVSSGASIISEIWPRRKVKPHLPLGESWWPRARCLTSFFLGFLSWDTEREALILLRFSWGRVRQCKRNCFATCEAWFRCTVSMLSKYRILVVLSKLPHHWGHRCFRRLLPHPFHCLVRKTVYISQRHICFLSLFLCDCLISLSAVHNCIM